MPSTAQLVSCNFKTVLLAASLAYTATGTASEQLLPLPARTIQAAATTLGQPAVFGQWSDVLPWPVIAVHANLLPNGKVIAWDATPDDFDDDPHTTDNYTTRVTLWDPTTNLHVSANNDTNADLFCAGSSHLWDGRILFSGGDSGIAGLNGPLSNTSIYDPDTNSWQQMPDMSAPRWYSSNASLANGETLTFAGTYSPAPLAEVFQHNANWRSLPLATPAGLSENYQWMQATPQGKVMTFGPQNTLATIDTNGSGTLTPGATRDQFPLRRYGSYAMYNIGKVLVTGGTDKTGQSPATSSAVSIDTATQQTTDTSAMTYRRTQHNLTILADGSVLASGGYSGAGALLNLNEGVLTPEIWSPQSGQWRTMNDMQIERQYHSVALLLPSGRVLSAGGGYCGDCEEQGYQEQNAELFSPPYLFSTGSTPAQQPVISTAPVFIDYAASFQATSGQAANIRQVHLIKLGAVTHSTNQEQRFVPLSFTTDGNSLQIQAPANRNIAPPGHYMLFIVDDSGVPSVAKIVQVGQPLLKPGESISHTTKPGKPDRYVISSVAANKDMLVEINDHSANTTLKVKGITSAGYSVAACTQSANPGQALQCRMSNQANLRWQIEVSANNASRYQLSGNAVTRQNTDTTDTTDQNNSIVVSSGGGAISFSTFALLLLRRRRNL